MGTSILDDPTWVRAVSHCSAMIRDLDLFAAAVSRRERDPSITFYVKAASGQRSDTLSADLERNLAPLGIRPEIIVAKGGRARRRLRVLRSGAVVFFLDRSALIGWMINHRYRISRAKFLNRAALGAAVVGALSGRFTTEEIAGVSVSVSSDTFAEIRLWISREPSFAMQARAHEMVETVSDAFADAVASEIHVRRMGDNLPSLADHEIWVYLGAGWQASSHVDLMPTSLFAGGQGSIIRQLPSPSSGDVLDIFGSCIVQARFTEGTGYEFLLDLRDSSWDGFGDVAVMTMTTGEAPEGVFHAELVPKLPTFMQSVSAEPGSPTTVRVLLADATTVELAVNTCEVIIAARKQPKITDYEWDTPEAIRASVPSWNEEYVGLYKMVWFAN